MYTKEYAPLISDFNVTVVGDKVVVLLERLDRESGLIDLSGLNPKHTEQIEKKKSDAYAKASYQKQDIFNTVTIQAVGNVDISNKAFGYEHPLKPGMIAAIRDDARPATILFKGLAFLVFRVDDIIAVFNDLTDQVKTKTAKEYFERQEELDAAIAAKTTNQLYKA